VRQAIRADAVIAREVRTIKLAASREFFARIIERNESWIGHHGSSASLRFDAQFDIELACDCAHHLLGARQDDTDRAAYSWADEAWAYSLPHAPRGGARRRGLDAPGRAGATVLKRRLRA
jgi:hypothetical protein